MHTLYFECTADFMLGTALRCALGEICLQMCATPQQSIQWTIVALLQLPARQLIWRLLHLSVPWRRLQALLRTGMPGRCWALQSQETACLCRMAGEAQVWPPKRAPLTSLMHRLRLALCGHLQSVQKSGHSKIHAALDLRSNASRICHLKKCAEPFLISNRQAAGGQTHPGGLPGCAPVEHRRQRWRSQCALGHPGRRPDPPSCLRTLVALTAR